MANESSIGTVTAGNADSDRSVSTSMERNGISSSYANNSMPYRIATSIPYDTAAATETRIAGFATDILKADIVDSYTTRNFKDYNYAGTNQNATYLYRKATALTYL